MKTKTEIQAELDQFSNSAEKFEYLSGLSELSWDDCQDVWFAAKKLIPEVAKELRLAAEREKVLQKQILQLSVALMIAEDHFGKYKEFDEVVAATSNLEQLGAEE